jgi:hypothetical protein
VVVYWRKTLFLVLLSLSLAGCGLELTDPSRVAIAASGRAGVPELRTLFPADLDGDGNLDHPAHPEQRRILVQAPWGTQFRLSRLGVDLPFVHAEVILSDGNVLHELELHEPLGLTSTVLEAGRYAVVLYAEAGPRRPLEVQALSPGAVVDDLAVPASALFPGTLPALLLRGALPSLRGGLALRSGSQHPVPLHLSVHPQGLRAEVSRALLPGRVYRLEADATSTTPFSSPFEQEFYLMCRGAPGRHAVALRVADFNRNGSPDLLCLFSDGALTVLTDPDGGMESLLPPGNELGVDFAVGDLNGNGATDIAVLLKGAEGARLLLLENRTRREGARFEATSLKLGLSEPVAVVLADFDRDGRDDVAVLDAFGELWLRFSSGDERSFSTFEGRRLATVLLADDFDADGKPDLMILGAAGQAKIWSRLLDRVPSMSSLYAGGSWFAASGDLDGDRFADLLLSGRAETLHALHGATRMETALMPRAGLHVGAVICRDVNGNSRGDVVAMLEDHRGTSSHVALYLNSQHGSLEPDAVLPVGNEIHVRAIEFWRDHVVFAAEEGLLVLPVDGAAMPPSATTGVRFVEGWSPLPPVATPLSAAIADFNDDGRADFAVVDTEGWLRVWVAGEPGEPFALLGEPIYLGGPGDLRAVDLERNRAVDLLFIPRDPSQRPRVLRNRRDGTFREGASSWLPLPPSNLRGAPVLGDFNRDLQLDVFWPSPLGRLQYHDGMGRWTDWRNAPEIRDAQGLRLQFSGELCCGDFTGNGLADIAAVMQAGEGAAGGQVLVLLAGTGDAEQPFQPVITRNLQGHFKGLRPADFSGDGRLDLAVGFSAQGEDEPRLTLLRLNAGREFEPFAGGPQARGALLDIAVDDLDRDGDLDLLVAERTEQGRTRVTLWVNDGYGRFYESEAAQHSLTEALRGMQATNLSLADFTGDGRTDLMAIDADGNVVLVRTTLR